MRSRGETGGPKLSANPTPGCGLRLIDGIVGHQLGGMAELEFRDDGLACTLHIPNEPGENPANP